MAKKDFNKNKINSPFFILYRTTMDHGQYQNKNKKSTKIILLLRFLPSTPRVFFAGFLHKFSVSCAKKYQICERYCVRCGWSSQNEINYAHTLCVDRRQHTKHGQKIVFFGIFVFDNDKWNEISAVSKRHSIFFIHSQCFFFALL